MNLEKIILKNLVDNEEYIKRVLPFLKDEYFTDINEKRIFSIVKDYILKYNKGPATSEIFIEIDNLHNVSEQHIKECKSIINEIQADSQENNIEWLVDSSEKFCKEKAIYNAMLSAMQILEGKDKKQLPASIPNILSDALAIGFETKIGHDYLEDYKEQYEWYHKTENKLKLDLEVFNQITNGGIPEKSLTVGMAGIHVGKTRMMCSFAAGILAQGGDVLYITKEMSEQMITQRIDANLMNVDVDTIKSIPWNDYERKAKLLNSKANGKLIIKEFPTGTANALHFRILLDELYLKKKFKPAMIFVDYINICSSARYKPGTAGMYEYIMSIGQELRGLAVERNTRVFTCTQLNRDGFKSSDPGIESTAESFGLPAIADFMFVMVTNDNLKKMDHMLVKQLKNRFGSVDYKNKFMVGIDNQHMRLYDLKEESQTEGLHIPKSIAGITASAENFKNIKV